MTLIIGLKHKGEVYLAGDRAAVDGWTNRLSAEPKIFRVGEFLIGTCGSRRMAQLIQHHLTLIPQGADQPITDYLVTEFAYSVRQLLTTQGIVTKSDTGEDRFSEGGLLFGYRGGLYRLSSNFQVDAFKADFDAIGSGAPFALGALQYMVNTRRDYEQLETRGILLEAMTVAEDLCADVSAPFDVYRLRLGEGLNA
jgi:ATP-dependent protease HslVU (ClpYQ) peptidase subunit